MRWQLLRCLLLATILVCCDGTLSKSDRKSKGKEKEKKVKDESPSSIVYIDDDDTEAEREIHLDEHPEEVSMDSILGEHSRLETGEKKFALPTLAYVTPWNNRGYDIAKWAAKKFTHISPVWLQLKAAVVKNKKTCTVTGTHDIDQGWVKDIRSNNSDIAIVPRAIMEGWSPDDVEVFLYDEMWQSRCVNALIDILMKNKFEGAVVEIWLQLLSITRGQHREELVEIVESWSDYFHTNDLEFILPITPPLDSKNTPTGIITPDEFARLAERVDYINLMTYDYHSERLEGVAPVDWVRRNVQFLLSESPVSATKVLMGLNFYGYELSEGTLNAVIASRFLELISTETAQIGWNPSSKEHFVQVPKLKSICYFPSITSIGVRLELARQLNVGVGIWEIGQGLDYFTKLL